MPSAKHNIYYMQSTDLRKILGSSTPYSKSASNLINFFINWCISAYTYQFNITVQESACNIISMNIACCTHSFFWHIVMSKQLLNNSFKHWVSNKVYQVHFTSITMLKETGLELLGQKWTHLRQIRGDQPSFNGVVNGTVILEERFRWQSS